MMNRSIKFDTNEATTIYMMMMDRIRECDELYELSIKFDDTEGTEYWSKEKNIALSIQSKLDGVF